MIMIESKNKEKIINDLILMYNSYDFIDEDYINRILNSISVGDFNFEGFNFKFMSSEINDVFSIKGKCIEILNLVLANMAKNDENILLQLMIDNNKTVSFVLRKLKLDEKNPIYDEYLANAILSYDGSCALSSWITSYFLKMTKKHYIPEKSNVPLVFKEKTKSHGTLSTSNNAVYENKEETKVNNVAQKDKDELKQNVVLEELINSDIKAKDGDKNHDKKSNSIDNKRESRKEESIVIEKINSKEKIKQDITNTQSYNHNNSDNFDVIDQESSEEQSVLIKQNKDNSQEITHINNSFNLDIIFTDCNEKCAKVKGMEKPDYYFVLFHYLQMDKAISVQNNRNYLSYLLVRFGFASKEYYTLEQVSEILKISMIDIIEYEKFTVLLMKNLLNNSINNF